MYASVIQIIRMSPMCLNAMEIFSSFTRCAHTHECVRLCACVGVWLWMWSDLISVCVCRHSESSFVRSVASALLPRINASRLSHHTQKRFVVVLLYILLSRSAYTEFEKQKKKHYSGNKSTYVHVSMRACVCFHSIHTSHTHTQRQRETLHDVNDWKFSLDFSTAAAAAVAVASVYICFCL